MCSLLDAKSPYWFCRTYLHLALSLRLSLAFNHLKMLLLIYCLISFCYLRKHTPQAVNLLSQWAFYFCRNGRHQLICLSCPWTLHRLLYLLVFANLLREHERDNSQLAPFLSQEKPTNQIYRIFSRSHKLHKASCLNTQWHLGFVQAAYYSSHPRSTLTGSPCWKCNYRSLARISP